MFAIKFSVKVVGLKMGATNREWRRRMTSRSAAWFAEVVLYEKSAEDVVYFSKELHQTFVHEKFQYQLIFQKDPEIKTTR
jgi:hypothetical protein